MIVQPVMLSMDKFTLGVKVIYRKLGWPVELWRIYLDQLNTRDERFDSFGNLESKQARNSSRVSKGSKQRSSIIVAWFQQQNDSLFICSEEREVSHFALHDLSESDCKRNLILDNNSTKGAVDTLDQCVHAYSSSRGTNRWPNKILFNILDIAAFNGSIIFFQNQPEWNSRKLSKRRLYLLELSKQLAFQHMDRRAQSMNLPVALRRLLSDQGFTNRQISAHVDAAASDSATTRGRCHLCDNRTLVRVRCSQCLMFSCKDHSSKIIRCGKCQEQQ